MSTLNRFASRAEAVFPQSPVDTAAGMTAARPRCPTLALLSTVGCRLAR